MDYGRDEGRDGVIVRWLDRAQIRTRADTREQYEGLQSFVYMSDAGTRHGVREDSHIEV